MNSIFRAFFKNTFEFILQPIRQLFGFLRRLIPGLKWFLELKPEILSTVLLFLFLLIIWISFRFLPGSDTAEYETQLRNWKYAFLVIVAITIVFYFGLRTALRPPKSPFPGIDESWQVGVEALQKNGIRLKDVPIQLILGLHDVKQIKKFIETSERSFEIEGVTGSDRSVIWYASQEFAYLFLADVGNFSEFIRKSKQLQLVDSDDGSGDYGNTIDVRRILPGRTPAPSAPEEDYDDSAALGSTLRAEDAIAGYSQSDQDSDDDLDRLEDDADPMEAPVPTRVKVSLQQKRLKHLATLLQRARQPVCAINGMAAVADLNLLESYPGELSRNLRSDLSDLTGQLGVVCSAIMIVTGFSRDDGFLNLAQRMVQERGAGFLKSKFGKSYRTWTPASQEQLEKLATSAVEEFDSFVHLVFTKRNALSSEHVQGNRSLVLFMCRLYSSLAPALREFLGKGFGVPKGGGNFELPRFGGCYFMGQDEYQSYFAQKVFDRMDENQGELEWTSASLRSDENWQILGNIAYLIGLSSLAALIFLFIKNQS